MEYSEKFIEMLNIAEENKLYVGNGKPDAKILIIGKELAFNAGEQPGQAEEEINSNVSKWKENVKNNTSQDEVQCKDMNPLYLYKGCLQPGGHTWSKYQKLINYIKPHTRKKGMDFQEFAFITEYNENPSKISTLQNKEARLASIKKRDEFFRSTPFFQQFPIVIVAAGDYGGNKFGVELEKTFGVKHKDTFKLRKGEWYSLHYASGKLVVHTRQLSTAISDKFLEEIAQKVKDFMREQHIEL